MEEMIIDHIGEVIRIETVYADREVNFSVHNDKGYLFRMVPASSPNLGFDISALDKSLEVSIDPALFQRASEAIESYYS
jgi:hypothetical protein